MRPRIPNKIRAILVASTALWLATAGAAVAEENAKKGSGPASATSKPPTEIVAKKSASFDEKTRVAIFVGQVRVKDPQFDLSSDKLTAFLAKELKEAASGAQNPASSQTMGGLERIIAEGHVVIVQGKPGEKPGETTRYVAKAARAEYDTKTEELKLTGWPQVQQGINSHVAVTENTIMYLSKGGQMRTEGYSKTLIQEQVEEPRK